MAKQSKEIEIPFGANDSELCGWEYTIPEGMEATIVDNKIVVKKKESKNERIRKTISEILLIDSDEIREILDTNDVLLQDIDAWFEKQGEQSPAWSEEDEKMIDDIIDYMTPMPIFFESTNGESDKEYTQKFIKQAINWLKFLKERIKYD